MKATITIAIELDEEYLVTEAARRGVATDVISREVIGGLECSLVDVVYSLRGHGTEGLASARSEIAQAGAVA